VLCCGVGWTHRSGRPLSGGVLVSKGRVWLPQRRLFGVRVFESRRDRGLRPHHPIKDTGESGPA
jgi:hypothetical protein